MATRYEIVLEDGDRFFFQLRDADGGILLRSMGSDSKIMTQNGILHLRNALRDQNNLTTKSDAKGHHVEVDDRDGSLLARSRTCKSEGELLAVIASILAAAGAPMVDLSKRRQQAG